MDKKPKKKDKDKDKKEAKGSNKAAAGGKKLPPWLEKKKK